MNNRFRPRRRLRSISLKGLWGLLSEKQQEQVRTFSWSASIHVLILSIFACIHVASNALAPPVELTADFGDDGETDLLALELPLDLSELLAPISELMPVAEDPMLPEIPVFPDLESLVQSIPTPLRDQGESSPAADQAQAASSSVSGSDAALIAETDRRVKKAGGELNGPVRISLMFEGDADIDLHVQYSSLGRQPRDNLQFYIWYISKVTEHGALDVDANANPNQLAAEPCENVIFNSVPARGNIMVAIHCFRPSSNFRPTPYVVTISYGKTKKVFKGALPAFGPVKSIYQFRFNSR